jgi:Fic family protein
MPLLMELLEAEESGAVRAVLGHFVFVFIHPYIDGNGRLGRFIMNYMLTTAGYVWTIVPVQQRAEYMAALEQASSARNIRPFAQMLARLVTEQTASPLSRESQRTDSVWRADPSGSPSQA